MTPSPSTQFQPGALVRLRSGGPVMTIHDESAESGGVMRCRWFLADGNLKDENFWDHTLEAVPDNRWLDQPDGPGYWWLDGGAMMRLVEVNPDMSVWWHGSEVEQMAHTVTGHKWCKAADEPLARP